MKYTKRSDIRQELYASGLTKSEVRKLARQWAKLRSKQNKERA